MFTVREENKYISELWFLDTCVFKYVSAKMQSSSLIGAFSVHDQNQSQQVLSTLKLQNSALCKT